MHKASTGLAAVLAGSGFLDHSKPYVPKAPRPFKDHVRGGTRTAWGNNPWNIPSRQQRRAEEREQMKLRLKALKQQRAGQKGGTAAI